MGKALVIVESPAKARTIGGLLGPDFIVESSIGHIRDLPRGADEVPAAYKGEGWARLGVDVDNGFKPLYVVSASKKSVVANLKRLLKDADELYLATDEDREGESIAWHLFEVLSPTVPVKRMVFHEITPEAIARAVEEWRDLDRRLVDAQEARRILDRLYGYEVSPVLWRKVMPRLSAGRVQSVATRMVVERERARMRFHSATWWGIDGTFTHAAGSRPPFGAALVSLGGTTVATGKDFNDDGVQTSKGTVRVLVEEEATAVAGRAGRPVLHRQRGHRAALPALAGAALHDLDPAAGGRAQAALQRPAGHAGGPAPLRAGLHHLHADRLDHPVRPGAHGGPHPGPRDVRRRLRARHAAPLRAQGQERPGGPRGHPPGRRDRSAPPSRPGAALSGDELRLYELIWMRTVASQMNDATGTSAQIRLVSNVPATGPDGGPNAVAVGEEAEFSASGRVIAFPGFLRAYVEGEDDPDAELADREVVLPALAVGDVVEGTAFEPGSHTTQPPARYTEASLVKAMEELGVGRPVDLRQRHRHHSRPGLRLEEGHGAGAQLHRLRRRRPPRALLRRPGRLRLHGQHGGRPRRDRLGPRGVAALALALLLRHVLARGALTAPAATATVAGNGDRGNGAGSGKALGLKASVAAHLGDIDAREINSILIGEGSDGVPIVARVGRYGPYLQHGDDRASLPDDMAPDELTVARSEELLAAPTNDRVLGIDPETGSTSRSRPAGSGPTSSSARPVKVPPSRAPRRSSPPWTRPRSPSSRRSSSCASRARWGRIPRAAKRWWPTTASSGPT